MEELFDDELEELFDDRFEELFDDEFELELDDEFELELEDELELELDELFPATWNSPSELIVCDAVGSIPRSVGASVLASAAVPATMVIPAATAVASFKAFFMMSLLVRAIEGPGRRTGSAGDYSVRSTMGVKVDSQRS